eukprot:3546130-Pyramimonas_sp.AAC.1
MVSFEGIATEVVSTNRAIVAGCSCATSLLRLVRLSPADAVVQRYASVDLAIVVDGLQLQWVGDAWEVAYDLKGAEDLLTSELPQIGLSISPPKKHQTVVGQNLRSVVRK